MATTINVRSPAELRKAWKQIADGVARPFKSTRRMFTLLGVQIDRDTMLTFKNLGAQGGTYRDRGPWPAFNRGRGVGFYDIKRGSTTRTRTGKWKVRLGTDGTRDRYSLNSKLLQRSGSYRNSFRIIQLTNKNMKYGTTHPLAGQIGSDPERQVLWYTPMDQRRYTKTIYDWWFGETKI